MSQTVDSVNAGAQLTAKQADKVEQNVANLTRIGSDLDHYITKYKT